MGDWVTIWIGATIGTFLAIVLLATVAFCFSRGFVRWAVGHFVKIVMNDRYPENIGEIVSALTRVSPQKVLENSLRSAEGIAIDRPFGSPRKFLDYDSLLFSPPNWRCFLHRKARRLRCASPSVRWQKNR